MGYYLHSKSVSKYPSPVLYLQMSMVYAFDHCYFVQGKTRFLVTAQFDRPISISPDTRSLRIWMFSNVTFLISYGLFFLLVKTNYNLLFLFMKMTAFKRKKMHVKEMNANTHNFVLYRMPVLLNKSTLTIRMCSISQETSNNLSLSNFRETLDSAFDPKISIRMENYFIL